MLSPMPTDPVLLCRAPSGALGLVPAVEGATGVGVVGILDLGVHFAFVGAWTVVRRV